MQDLAFGDLSVHVADDPTPGWARLVWSGKSNDRQPGKVLDPFLGIVVKEAAEKGLGIEMRFERLEHFNSATITSLIGLVQQARSKGIKLALVFDKALKWQKLSFDALRVLGKGDGLLEIRSMSPTPMSAGAAPSFSIDLPVRADWQNAERLRSSIQSCLLAAGCTADAGYAVAVVTAELAENAVKYGAYRDGVESFRIRISGDLTRARIVVESPAVAGAPSTARLFEILAWIGSFPSAEEAYRARLLEIADASTAAAGSPPSAPSSSRLGLVRLVYEASCTLRAELDGDVLRVTAELPL